MRVVKDWTEVVKLDHSKVSGLAWGKDAAILASVGMDKSLKIWA